jgi:hypothetical protein
LKGRAAGLLAEVHRLARAYHWSQGDILALAVDRRLAYLVMLEQEADARLLTQLDLGGLE